MTATVTKRTVTYHEIHSNQENSYLSLLMSVLYFLSFREHRMVRMRPSCDESKLDLNMFKTKAIIVDFRRRGHSHDT